MNATSIMYHQYGEPLDVLEVLQKKLVSPSDSEILVRMLCRPINPSDLIPITGAYSHRMTLPQVPGYEGVGMVEEVGANVSSTLIGKRVLPLRGEGTWQEYVKSSSEFAVVIPSLLNDETAAQLYINPLTAWVICAELLRLREGQTLLVNAASSSIGRIFCQLATALNFRLIAVVRNQSYEKELLRLGAAEVVHPSNQPLYETVQEITGGKGATAAVDLIGGTAGHELAKCVCPGGQYLSIGLLSGEPVNWRSIVQNMNVRANLFHLRNWNQAVSTYTWHQSFERIIELIHRGKLILTAPNKQFPLVDVKDAVLYNQETSEKVLLV